MQNDIAKTVSEIIADVRENGDAAVKKYTEKFDKVALVSFEVPAEEIESAYKTADRSALRVMKFAAKNIRKFAEAQIKQFRDFDIETIKGCRAGQKIVPLERAGLYVPGGRFPLPSSALMAIIPAKVAGVDEVIVCSPPSSNGSINPLILVASKIGGADRVFKIGGVQAIAAMAYGTKTVPRVDKIAGPGNAYVAEAKKQVYGDVGIDIVAGPSEVMIIADETANPAFIASDLLAQAEHDVNASATLITISESLAEKVKKKLEAQLNVLKTANIARESMNKNGKTIIVKTIEEAIEVANKTAPEHLELQIENPKKYLDELRNYGSLFLGNYSAEVLADYVAGINHVLPTRNTARYCSGLSVKDFVKMQTWLQVDNKSYKDIGKMAAKFAGIEGLDAHKASAEARIFADTKPKKQKSTPINSSP
ncbi:Histidinol dehydrogenase [uncultured archaeon]|nr:Histidinol dehydrogenase [uncultured archaeon]